MESRGKEIVLYRENSLKSWLNNTSAQLANLFKKLVTYFNALPTESLIAPTKKKARVKTKYADNVTAALSLSTTVKKKNSPCHVIDERLPAPGINFLSETLSSIFNRSKIANQQSHQVDKKSNNKSKTILQVMLKLVEDYNKLEDPEGIDKLAAEKILINQVELVEHEIIEHAQRRVDLYFYLLVAVYKQEALVIKKSTNKQHGMGSNLHGTHAAHDSLFPHVKLKFANNFINFLWSKLSNLPSIVGTHFEDSNNMTVELPIWVNKFDAYMELMSPGRQSAPSGFVKQCLNDLNLSSLGQISPIDGMNRFLKNIKTFFASFEEKYLNDSDDHLLNKKLLYPKLMQRIWELQYTGTLRAQAFESDTVDIKYICSLLRIKPTLKIIQDPSSLLNYCLKIQKEIFNTPSELENKNKLKV